MVIFSEEFREFQTWIRTSLALLGIVNPGSGDRLGVGDEPRRDERYPEK